ncbi:MAG: hypothetical protein KDK39_19170 [Leptospiraceae bacterium]|nr:hypothetical protein [Leptospiraceae bacterium]
MLTHKNYQIGQKTWLASGVLAMSVILLLSACTQLGLSEEKSDAQDLLGLGALLLANSTNSQNCAEFPQTITDSTGTWTCSVAGLVRSCSCTSGCGTYTSVSWTYSSVAVALKGVADSPWAAAAVLPTGFRGVQIKHNSGGTNYTITSTLDTSDRLSTWSIAGGASATLTLSNYDTNGFPQNYTGSATGTVSYVYGAGGNKPTKITNSNGNVFNYSNGIMSSYDSGGSTTVTSSGTIKMCN